ncbi:MAG: hypothetical protein QOJ99_2995 [Bryobacterales bacterium]|jgi:hypothetical protein|nr:hypothetical protein [Bryobacterales bacterium]
MPDLLVRSFAPFLLAFQPCFTQPGFSSFRALTCARILCSGRRSRVVKESSDSGVELKQAAEAVATENGLALGT